VVFVFTYTGTSSFLPTRTMLPTMRMGLRNPPLSNRMQGNCGGGRGTTSHYTQLNRHILDCGSTGELCELIESHAEEFDAVNVATAFRKLLQSQ
jgi:hypothetical protein